MTTRAAEDSGAMADKGAGAGRGRRATAGAGCTPGTAWGRVAAVLAAGAAWLAFAALSPAQAAPVLDAPACLVPAKAGGGFDLTCRMAGALLAQARLSKKDMAVSYLPGGIGAVAYDRVVTGRLAAPGSLVAFSSGSLLNLAQGKFGPHTAADVRWVAALATDYGVIAVHRDSPLQSLPQLEGAIRRDLSQVVFGAGGTVGSQDWVKAALIVKAAGRDHKAMRFVSFEGGGEALVALGGRHVTVFCGDMGEVVQAIAAGAPVRILAVLSPRRLPGKQAGVPTAREQGLDLVWPTLRGVYVSAAVGDEPYRQWVGAFDAALRAPGAEAMPARFGLYPVYPVPGAALTGQTLTDHVQQQVKDYRALAAALGLRTRGP